MKTFLDGPVRLQIASLVLCLAASPVSAQATPRRIDDGGRRIDRSTAVAVPEKARPTVRGGAGSPPSIGASPSCIAERKIALDPAAGALHVGLKTYPQTVSLHDREVVLTFDDGPAPDTTPRVLEALKAACVHATFFLIGRHSTEHPALARREVAEGHSVGHHSLTHPAFTLRGFDTASGERDIAAGIAADEQAVYGKEAAPEHPHVPFFRFPGFADTPALLDYLDRRKFAVFGTDLWAADWLQMTPDQERERVLALLEKTSHHSGILLFHDTRRWTAAMLPGLLAALRAKGYTIAHLVYEAGTAPPALNIAGHGWSAETERIIAHLHHPIVQGSHHAGDDRGAAGRRSETEPCRSRARAV